MKHKEKSVYKKKDRKKVRSVIIRDMQMNPERIDKTYRKNKSRSEFLFAEVKIQQSCYRSLPLDGLIY